MIPYVPPRMPDSIPVIDLEPSFTGGMEGEARVAWEIHKAARECGFFYVKNHGVPQAVVDGAFAAMRSFFEKPLDYKLSVLRDNWPVPRGYEPLFYQQLDAGTPRDVKESFYVATEHGPDHPGVIGKWPNHGPNHWPKDLPGFREGIEAYFNPMCDLGRHLMRLIALSLEPQQMWSTLRHFGFGQVTSSRFPGESAGVLTSYANWRPVTIASMSFGSSPASCTASRATLTISVSRSSASCLPNGVCDQPMMQADIGRTPGREKGANTVT